jgi:hypothetical protein
MRYNNSFINTRLDYLPDEVKTLDHIGYVKYNSFNTWVNWSIPGKRVEFFIIRLPLFV